MSAKVEVKKSKLMGEVTVSGAKNSSLKLLTASILTNGNVEILNTPNSILDFRIHVEMLRVLGKEIIETSNSILIKEKVLENELNWNDRSIRNTLLILGSLLTRTGYGKVPLPGGCKLGERKYDLHVDAMESMGAKVWEEGEYLFAKAENGLVGTEIKLPIRSTGATENAILMGTLAKGTTRVWNPHIRPEILDMIDMLNSMGANIRVNGQESIIIEGVDGLSSVTHKCIPDNMEALTFVIAAAITNGDVTIHNFPLEHLEIPMIHLRESGLHYYISENRKSLIIKPSPKYPVDIATGAYPSINSDMQPLFAIYGLLAQGESNIIDLRFPGRYQYTQELNKIGASTSIDGNILKIHGGNTLTGCEVKALDLRAGAALVLAGLVAEGTMIVASYEQVQRGYENFTDKLRKLGATINEI